MAVLYWVGNRYYTACIVSLGFIVIDKVSLSAGIVVNVGLELASLTRFDLVMEAVKSCQMGK